MDKLGIDIGTVSVKYVRFKGKKDNNTVGSKGSYTYNGDYDNLVEILGDIFEKEGSLVDVYIGLTSQDVVKRTFTIPVVPKNELKEAMNWSVSKVVNTPLEGMIYEYRMLGEVDERGVKKQEALFTGIQKDHVDNVLKAFNDAGFKRIRLLTDNAFTYVPVIGDGAGSVAVIDIGGRQSGIYIFDDKKIKFIREIMTASESFTDALMSGLNLTYEEAEQYKFESGFTEETDDALSMPMGRLSGEVQRTFSVYNQRYPKKQVSRAIVAGGGSKIPGFLAKLAENLVEETMPLKGPANVEEEFITAYILGTYGDTLVNLLPPEIKAREREAKFKKWIRIGVVGLGAILLLVSLHFLSKLNREGIAVDMEKRNLEIKKRQLFGLDDPAALSSCYNEFLAVQNEIKKSDATFLLLMKYLSARLPANVRLNEIIYDRHKAITAMAVPVLQEDIPKDKRMLAEAKAAREAARSAATPASVARGGRNPAGGKEDTQEKDVVDQERDPGIRLWGFIRGEQVFLELTLVDVVTMLRKSGFIEDVEIIKKDIKEVKGGIALEFVIQARCLAYEI